LTENLQSLFSHLLLRHFQDQGLHNSGMVWADSTEAPGVQNSCRLHREWPTRTQTASLGTQPVVCFTMGKNPERRSRTVLEEPPVRHLNGGRSHQRLSNLPRDGGEISVWITVGVVLYQWRVNVLHEILSW